MAFFRVHPVSPDFDKHTHGAHVNALVLVTAVLRPGTQIRINVHFNANIGCGADLQEIHLLVEGTGPAGYHTRFPSLEDYSIRCYLCIVFLFHCPHDGNAERETRDRITTFPNTEQDIK
jgi:hypothetical protein